MKENIFVLARRMKNATVTEWAKMTGLDVNLILSLEEGKSLADYNTLDTYSRCSGLSFESIQHFNKRRLSWFEKGLLGMLGGIAKIGTTVEKKEECVMEWVKIFVGIDPQVDFITGALPNEVAQGNVEMLNTCATDAREHDFIVAWTKDTHAKKEEDYLNTLEGKNLPIWHCGEGTDGWQFHPAIKTNVKDQIFMKPTFGSLSFAKWLWDTCMKKSVKCIIMGGYCTDICGISNAILARVVLPNVPIYWLAFSSAGVTPEKHDAALMVMESCQITVIKTYEEYQELLEKMN